MVATIIHFKSTVNYDIVNHSKSAQNYDIVNHLKSTVNYGKSKVNKSTSNFSHWPAFMSRHSCKAKCDNAFFSPCLKPK